jgi:WD40 repeat protein
LEPTNSANAQAPPAAAPVAPAVPVELHPVRALKLHTAGVLAVAYSPDGKTLATAGKDKLIVLWDVGSWRARGTLDGNPGDVSKLAFSPDGSRLASVTSAPDTCSIRLWDVRTATSASTLGGPNSGMLGLDWSVDGKWLVCAGWDRTVRVWEADGGEERLVIPDACTRFVRGVAFSPQADRIATGGTGPTRLWDARSGQEVPAVIPAEMCPSFLPSGDTLVGWSYPTGRVMSWDVPSGQVRALWQAHSGHIEGLAVSPDGRFLASLGHKGVARVWSTADQSEVATLTGHRGIVYAAAFAPDGAHLATVGLDDCTVLLWDLPASCHVRK